MLLVCGVGVRWAVLLCSAAGGWCWCVASVGIGDGGGLWLDPLCSLTRSDSHFCLTFCDIFTFARCLRFFTVSASCL